jgi:hypothetical protein
LLSHLRSSYTASRAIARTILATLLALALLSGVAPLSSLSRSHQCRMACCAGKPPHAEGSCSVAFAAAEDEREPADAPEGEAQAAHSHHAHDASSSASMKMASSDQDVAEHPTSQLSSLSKKSSPTLKVVSQVLTTPCSPECLAGALASTQLPGQRDAAAMSPAGNPRPPTIIRFRKEFSTVLSPSAERRRQIHPRAPPRLLLNLSA